MADDFRARFGQPLDEASLNRSHQIVIVAASLDDSTERIVGYLGERDIPINVLCFQVFTHGSDQILSRSWFLDPVHTQVKRRRSRARPAGALERRVLRSSGADAGRSWEDAVQFGFISGGGGAWYSKTLQLLNPGDRVWVKVLGVGFVGVGRAIGRAQPAAMFKVATPTGEVSVLDVATRGTYQREAVADPERCEYFVPMKWLDTVPLNQAFRDIGLFGNQNTVCKPTTPKWRSTVERLKQRFARFAES